jgi:TATA-box binding protein (TBP) (component of TFIID and TFIIIB)
MDLLAPIVNNIKASIRLKDEDIVQLGKILKIKDVTVHKNMLTLRDSYTYVIFPESGFVNICGIKSFDDVPNVIDKMCKDFSLDKTKLRCEITIDNVCASGDFKREIELCCLQEKIYCNKGFTVYKNQNYSPSAICKSTSFGTILVFSSGKYIIVGAKTLQDVERIFKDMTQIVEQVTIGKCYCKI